MASKRHSSSTNGSGNLSMRERLNMAGVRELEPAAHAYRKRSVISSVSGVAHFIGARLFSPY